jgi:hypothetical protein
VWLSEDLRKDTNKHVFEKNKIESHSQKFVNHSNIVMQYN